MNVFDLHGRLIEDYEPYFVEDPVRDEPWETVFRRWVRQSLKQGHESILDTAMPAFEQILIQTALEHTGGRRQEAARLLGWGRNTLTRKIKELQLDIETDPEESQNGED